MVLNQVHDGVQAAVYRAARFVRIAEVHSAGTLLVVRDVQRVIDQLADALVFGRGDRYDRDPQHGLHLVDADGAAVGRHLVHHVQGKHHRHAQLHELHGEVEVAGEVGRVDDVDDAARLFIQKELARDQLFAGVRGHGVNARQVSHQRVAVAVDDAVLAVNRHAREVAYVLVGAGELVKQGGLAAVLVAGKGEGQLLTCGQRRFVRLGVVLAAFAEAGMRCALAAGALRIVLLGEPNRGDGDAGGVGHAQRELVAVQAELHRVAHGRKLHQRNLRAGDDAHIQEVLAQRAFAAYGQNFGRLAGNKLIKRHKRDSFRDAQFNLLVYDNTLYTLWLGLSSGNLVSISGCV